MKVAISPRPRVSYHKALRTSAFLAKRTLQKILFVNILSKLKAKTLLVTFGVSLPRQIVFT